MAVFTPILFGTPNGGFELGDFTDWLANNSTIDTAVVRTGLYSSKLVASGGNITGCQTNPIIVDDTLVYTVDSYHNIPSWTSGTYSFMIQFFSDLLGSVYISQSTVFSKSALTSGWEQGTKTVGPSGSAPDISFPANTKSFRLHVKWTSTPTATAYLDDVLVTGPVLTIAPLESYSSERSTQKLQARRLTPGGKADVEDLGPELQFITLVLKNLSLANKNSLDDFIRNTVNWATNYFDFTDDQGIEYEDCLFWFNDWEPSQRRNQLFDEEIFIAVGI